MDTEITHEMVIGYIGAVTSALEMSGHEVLRPIFGGDEPHVEIILPEAGSDVWDAGLSLIWDEPNGWRAAHYDAQTRRREGHADLELGTVPAPGVIVGAVAAILAEGSLRAGRIRPGAADLLARYAGGPPPVQAPHRDLIRMTARDSGYGFGTCCVCGSDRVTRLGLFVSAQDNSPSRTAWCAAARCQDDWVVSATQTVPVVRAEEGGFRVGASW